MYSVLHTMLSIADGGLPPCRAACEKSTSQICSSVYMQRCDETTEYMALVLRTDVRAEDCDNCSDVPGREDAKPAGRISG